MRSISVEGAQEGMVLAAAVSDRRGRLLIPKGASLSDRHMHALRLWGIPQIAVEGEANGSESASAPSPERLAQAEAKVSPRFAGVGTDHPFLAQLRACAIERALQPAIDGGAGE